MSFLYLSDSVSSKIKKYKNLTSINYINFVNAVKAFNILHFKYNETIGHLLKTLIQVFLIKLIALI